jgi:hypothetical protein
MNVCLLLVSRAAMPSIIPRGGGLKLSLQAARARLRIDHPSRFQSGGWGFFLATGPPLCRCNTTHAKT